MKDLSREITAYALKNALEFGKADAGRILPKLFAHGLEKSAISSIMPTIQEIVAEVNGLSTAEKNKRILAYASLLPEKVEKEKDLPEIDVSGLAKVVTRLAPEPSKFNHLGHALTFLLNYLYAQKYGGECVLRFEDCNPEKVSKEYVDAMKQDVLDYLGITVGSIRFVSDDMPQLYTYGSQLIDTGHAYICTCNRDTVQDLRHNGLECECRQFPVSIQKDKWKLFIAGEYDEGSAVVRLKGNMQSQNHVMRDPVLFRIMKTPHYRQGKKYTAWPMYDFYNPIEDSLMGVTLILRSNEFDLRVELQDHLKDLLGLAKQRIIQYGRFNVLDFSTKGRELRELIDSGEISGWDDPRLITLRALKRRGITKEALYELVKQVGLSKHPVHLNFDMIAAVNRKLVDAHAPRYWFVQNPVHITIDNKPSIQEVSVPIHPAQKKQRTLPVDELYLAADDVAAYTGKEIRLLHLFNVQLEGKQARVSSLENKPIPKVHWVSQGYDAQVLMPDGQWVLGLVDPGAEKLKVGTILQFERFGFVRYDRFHNGRYEFWFTHK